MKIVVFGGSGSVGATLVPEALRRGHDVTAVTRNARSIRVAHPSLHVVQSELDGLARIEATFAGADAAIVLLGGDVVDGTRAIIDALLFAGVPRLEAVTGFGTSPQSRRDLGFPMRMLMNGVRLVTIGEFRPKERQDAIIRVSGLDFTIVQPPTLTAGAPVGTFRHGDYRGKSIFGSVTRADLAAFLLDNLELGRYVNESVSLQS